MIDKNKIGIIIGLICTSVSFMLWEYMPKGSFYMFDAIAWVSILYTLYNCVNEVKNKILVEYLLVGSINNLIDEFGFYNIFNNTLFSYSEMILFIIVTIYYARKYYVKRTDS